MAMIDYITGIYALNIHLDNDLTSGDWHSNILDNIRFSKTEDTRGLQFVEYYPYGNKVLNNVWVADHHRAVADMILADWGKPEVFRHKCAVNDYLDGDSTKLREYLRNLTITSVEEEQLIVSELGSDYLCKMKSILQ